MESLPVSVPPSFWWLSLIANIILLPTIGWFIKSYLPTKLAQQQKSFEVALETQKDEREYKQSTGNKILDVWLDQQHDINEGRAREIDELRKTVDRLGRQVDGLAASVRALAGEIEKGRGG